ncbi:MAG TPA: hypothetical protein VK304_12810 [Thermoleophilaceae bacterium]|nr:hypothetical protein [Thermoleophilaceae bacterium]
MTIKRLLVATLLTGFLGVALMIPFEGPLTRSLGTTCLIAFCVLGAFLIASPGYLAEEEDDP